MSKIPSKTKNKKQWQLSRGGIMSGSCNDCGNVMCVCDPLKPNNKFKYGDWVVAKETVFKIDNIRVFGDHFGYSGESIDGWYDQEDLTRANTSLLFELFKQHKEMGVLNQQTECEE